ncbi:selenocysteine lyase/cysteine desulfurase [Microterricola gilva]|uniref:Selenocysteine lyase/cysteine desulfurase n=1 Tax=Microterricola gilva TaxID=393267 RepID=A0A4Q8AMG8_9MICO|nr:aminotransferase class V-fold PLP-dependent enzyme [Microterricola gilva]RZU65790.1 selenocysteine lyase/cysteine desulfurase [Microterricola gilva]
MESLLSRADYATLESFSYLNQASLGLIPQPAVTAMSEFLLNTARHGNAHMSDADESAFLGELRSRLAELLDAPLASIAITGGASEGINQAAALLAVPGSEVVLVPSDFPAVTYPWLGARERIGVSIRWVEDAATVELTDALVEAISEDTSVVSFSAVQYATGTLVDVQRVVERAHAVGARVLVDVTQMAGAMPVSMREWGVDALVCSGYKWLSAHGGVAVLALREELLGALPAVIGWMGAPEPFDFHPDTLTLAGNARRFELSTMSYVSAAGLRASIDYLGVPGFAALEQHSRLLRAELVDAVAQTDWRPFRRLDASGASPHIVSLRHERIDAREAQARLTEQGVLVSSRGGGIRVSLHGYNDSSDVTRVVEVLSSLE